MVQHELDTGTRHLGKFGTPIKDSPGTGMPYRTDPFILELEIEFWQELFSFSPLLFFVPRRSKAYDWPFFLTPRGGYRLCPSNLTAGCTLLRQTPRNYSRMG